jgi:hypothetical protein
VNQTARAASTVHPDDSVDQYSDGDELEQKFQSPPNIILLIVICPLFAFTSMAA